MLHFFLGDDWCAEPLGPQTSPLPPPPSPRSKGAPGVGVWRSVTPGHTESGRGSDGRRDSGRAGATMACTVALCGIPLTQRYPPFEVIGVPWGYVGWGNPRPRPPPICPSSPVPRGSWEGRPPRSMAVREGGQRGWARHPHAQRHQNTWDMLWHGPGCTLPSPSLCAPPGGLQRREGGDNSQTTGADRALGWGVRSGPRDPSPPPPISATFRTRPAQCPCSRPLTAR